MFSVNKRFTKILLVFLLTGCYFFTGCCKKEPTLEEGGKAYQSGDFKKAAEIFLPAAKKGHAEAQANIAFMYYCGMNFEKDHKKAAEWYEKSARQNYMNAQFSLGTMYENGEGVESDPVKAYFWYSLAEKQGDKDAKRLRRELEFRLSGKELAKAKEMLQDWKAEK
ncbi:MAG: tetratricopeptide repeat protein [Candidatus Rifleibacteriota bacterium]